MIAQMFRCSLAATQHQHGSFLRATKHAMQGTFNQARLQVGNHGLTWVITPTVETSTTRDPFMRSSAFEIPAATR
jgi:hypothetical protein